MELQGKVIAALPEKSGVSERSGKEWKTQSFVIETHEAYPHKMAFDVFGADRLERFGIQVGQEVLVSFDIDAHEYQGRWFNSIRAFDVRLVDPATINQEAKTNCAEAQQETQPVAQQAQPVQPVNDTPF